MAGASKTGSTAYGYDTSDRLTAITHKKADNSNIVSYSYVLDNAGRPTSRTEGVPTQAFTYNDRDELTGDAGTAYTYDATGNRTTAGITTSAVGNRLLGDGVWTYSYDDEGQLTKKTKGAALETWTFGYDHRGQMTWAEKRSAQVSPLQARVEYIYDAFGNRIKRVQKNGLGTITSDERYVLDGWDTTKPGAVGTENFDVLLNLSSTNAVTMRRMFADGFDEPLARVPATGAAGWYLTDR